MNWDKLKKALGVKPKITAEEVDVKKDF